MRLDQLGLTPSGMKATKKLGKQVHKATVAAGMEPKLRLGVIGIEIGQEQSTGQTSLTEGQGEAVRTLIKAGKVTGFKSYIPPETNIDVWTAALMLERLRDEDRTKYQEASDLMHSLPSTLKENVQTSYAKELLGIVNLPGVVTQAAEAVVNLTTLHQPVRAYISDVESIARLVNHLYECATTGKDELDAKMAKAALLKAGIKS